MSQHVIALTGQSYQVYTENRSNSGERVLLLKFLQNIFNLDMLSNKVEIEIIIII